MTETGERCPDCLRPIGTNPPSVAGSCYVSLFREGEDGRNMHQCACWELTIARLRAELSTLRQSSEHQARLTEAERLLVDAALAWADGGTTDAPLEHAIRRVQRALRAKENTNANG